MATAPTPRRRLRQHDDIVIIVAGGVCALDDGVLPKPSAAAATATTAVAVGTAMANDDATRTMLLNLDIPNVSNRQGLCPLQCDSCHIIIRRRMREVFAWFLFSESVSRRRQVPENYWLLSANVMMSAGNFLSQRTAFLW
ncbi:unnamed protein product [Heligmosomoides polygyrus]|uniref:Uncharacterized protein n=1 Tax=Heligmosomoides polygyrus TaxID=6339 RepID=A0A183FPX5_HELPZ|nr:unnamed protein product [Heligmosomoides polygyrus]